MDEDQPKPRKVRRIAKKGAKVTALAIALFVFILLLMVIVGLTIGKLLHPPQ